MKNATNAANRARNENEILMAVLQAEIAEKLAGNTWPVVGSLQAQNAALTDLIVSLRCGADESEADVKMDILQHVQNEVA